MQSQPVTMQPLSPDIPSSFLPITSTHPSPTLSITLPFILLGRRGLNEQWDQGPGRHLNRLKIVRNALRKFGGGIVAEVWVPGVYEEGEGGEVRAVYGKEEYERENEMARRHKVEKQGAWQQKETQRRRKLEDSGCWILQHTLHTEDTPMAAGLLSDAEKSWLGGQVWTLPFSLQRFGVGVEWMNTFEREIDKVMHVLGEKVGAVHPKYGMCFRIVNGECCWPRVSFQPGEKGTSWDETTVGNVVSLHTALERELLVFATPTFLMGNWMLSRFLTQRAVKDLRRERKRRLNELTGGAGAGKVKRERRGMHEKEKEIRRWRRELEGEDEWVRGREKVRGREGRGWWEEIDQGEMRGLVEDIVGYKEGLVLRFEREVEWEEGEGPTDVSGDESGGEDEDDVPSNPGDNVISTSPRRTSLPPTPTPAPPQAPVTTISFAIPRLTISLAPSPLIAYATLLSKLLLFVHRNTEDAVKEAVKSTREASEEYDESPRETLRRIAKLVGVEEEYVRIWETGMERFWDGDPAFHSESRNERNVELERLLKDYGEGSEPPALEPLPFSLPKVSSIPNMIKAKKDDPFAPIMTHIEEFWEKEKEYMPRFLKRYERADGFLAPLKTKVYALMEAEEERRRVKREGGDVRGWLEGLGLESAERDEDPDEGNGSDEDEDDSLYGDR